MRYILFDLLSIFIFDIYFNDLLKNILLVYTNIAFKIIMTIINLNGNDIAATWKMRQWNESSSRETKKQKN